tara:strand:+ start:133 stop:381 length:249 start_codon:yes stop_codon:yes gene_type:complete
MITLNSKIALKISMYCHGHQYYNWKFFSSEEEAAAEAKKIEGQKYVEWILIKTLKDLLDHEKSLGKFGDSDFILEELESHLA